MSLQERVEKAKKLTFTPILSDKPEVGTWGSEDNFYRVEVTKSTEQAIMITGHQIKVENINIRCCQFDGKYDCKGNCKHTICYHAMGALIFILDQRGQEIDFCRDEFVARGTVQRDEWDRTKNNSHFAFIQSKQGRGSIWAVIRDKMASVNHGDMDQRVNSMRGEEEEEEGID